MDGGTIVILGPPGEESLVFAFNTVNVGAGATGVSILLGGPTTVSSNIIAALGDTGGTGIACAPLTTREDCDNGIDDNGNGLVDCADTNWPPCSSRYARACGATGVETCGNSVDDDRDGLDDEWDPDCYEAPVGEDVVNFNDVFGFVNAHAVCEAGDDEISVTPRFVGGTPFDFHLQDGSLCIDHGDPTLAPEDDFDGLPRDAEPDMGALEWR
jgi:hypothetical protein